MRFMILLYFLFAAFVIWVFSTQVIVPFFEKTPYFPFFRRTKKVQNELEAALQDVTQQEVNETLQHNLEVRKQFLKGKE